MPTSWPPVPSVPTREGIGSYLDLSSADCSGTQTPRGAGRRRRRLSAQLVASLSLLLSVGAVALIVWYSSAADARLLALENRLVKMLQNASVVARGRIERLELAAQVAAPDTATTLSAATVKPVSRAQEGRAIECRTKGLVACDSSYPVGCFVTSWPKDHVRPGQDCTAGNDGTIEMQTAGSYYVYSQALLSTSNGKGVAIVAVPSENVNRSVRVRHSLCLVDRTLSQPRELKSVEFVAMDQLTTYVGAHVWLPSGARLAVSLTSMKGLTDPQGSEANLGWDPVTIGWFRTSES